MQFGISNKGFIRLAFLSRGDFLSKEAIEYTDDWEESWEEEYGEDWGSEEYAQPDPEEIGGWEISQEDFAKGELILAGMGMDVENMTPEEIADILANNPQYLELVPQFNVQGQWVHTLRETHIPSLSEEIQKVISSDKELCVTAGEAAEFWNFSEYRMLAVVLEGTCKILWNADMFSTPEFGGRIVKNPGTRLEHLNEMTEGWIVPAECTLVGLKANWEKIAEQYKGNLYKVKEELESLATSFGVSIIESESMEKTLKSLEVLEAEEAMDYGSCEVDFGSPEHLYEPPEDDLYDNYMQYYGDQLMDAINQGDAPRIQELTELGAAIDVSKFEKAANATALVQANLPMDTFRQLMATALESNNQKAMDKIFRATIWEDRFDYSEALANVGYQAGADMKDVFEMLLAMDNPPLDLMKQAFSNYGQTQAVFIDSLFDEYDFSPEIISFLFKDLNTKLYINLLRTYDEQLVKAIAQAVPEKVNALIQQEEAKASKYPDMASEITDSINQIKQKIAS